MTLQLTAYACPVRATSALVLPVVCHGLRRDRQEQEVTATDQLLHPARRLCRTPDPPTLLVAIGERHQLLTAMEAPRRKPREHLGHHARS